jgi:hypothetical protein
MCWTIEVLGFDSRRELGIFLLTIASRTALRRTQPPIQWVPGALSLGVKRPGREAEHSPPSSAEVKNAWGYTSAPPYALMEWCLFKHRDNLTLPPWTGDRPVARPLPTQDSTTQINADMHPCPVRDSNPRTQCSGDPRQ